MGHGHEIITFTLKVVDGISGRKIDGGRVDPEGSKIFSSAMYGLGVA